MMTRKILVPYDFTSYNQKALDFVVENFGNSPDVHVTLFHAYAQLPEIDLTANPEMLKLRSPMISLKQELREKETELKALTRYFVKNGFGEEQLKCIFQEREKGVSEAIVRMAKKEGCRIIVLSRSSGRVSLLMGRSTSSKIITSLTDVTVCIAL
ncbi:universal stress family protein [delta proteobacterium NaphS2]|nr:universal stress family protein [delta proteobacterium NaphS2]